jgi:hypothetical protein
MSADADRAQRLEEVLRHPERIAPAIQRRRVIFRLTRAPALKGPCYAWAVMGATARQPGTPALVREIRLRRDAVNDAAAWRVRDVEIAPDKAEAWCREGAMVCERELGVSLDESEQTSNWSRRPLDANQLRYAALDAEILLELHDRLAVG